VIAALLGFAPDELEAGDPWTKAVPAAGESPLICGDPSRARGGTTGLVADRQWTRTILS
jgi:hypothetical protein